MGNMNVVHTLSCWLIAAALLLGCSAANALQVGEPVALPDIKLHDGSLLRAAELKGKVVVIEYWASWCPFCKNTMPHLQKLYDANKAAGLEVIVLSIDKTEREAVDALRERGFSFRAGMASDDTNRVFGRLRGLPVTYVIGRDGRLARQDLGELFPEDIAEFADFLKPAR
jgi:thiol-disulfide isomerase/thioredoxin